ncbi:MAG: LysM peptidoglycan-binding domain-containing protein [Eubacterium sp.]|nr:LysM peptidoglycan-binding domain-containing protein [Eubacterium sp.]
MELPKNITQIGESDKFCKIYAEDYVVSYLKQLNRVAGDKNLAVALYGIRKEEDGISYLFLYGAAKLNFLQRESRHLSQAVQQEAEKLRQRYFREYGFLGYKILNGEMIEGFQICDQGVCRYISGYAQFYEKNDSMLAYMLEQRQEDAMPEQVEQEKYDMVKRRQEERRLQAELEKRQSGRREKPAKDKPSGGNLRRMKYSAAIVFAFLCVAGLATVNNGNGLSDLQAAARRMIENVSQQQIPDAVEVGNFSAEAGTVVAEEKLAEAIKMENDAAASAPAVQTPQPESSSEPGSAAATPEPTVMPTPGSTPTPTPDLTPEPSSEPTAYVIKRGDTLIGICMTVYGSDARLREVCELNDIGDPDDIKVGQKILLP